MSRSSSTEGSRAGLKPSGLILVSSFLSAAAATLGCIPAVTLLCFDYFRQCVTPVMTEDEEALLCVYVCLCACSLTHPGL